MAKRFSELPSVTTMSASDVICIESSGVSKSITYENMESELVFEAVLPDQPGNSGKFVTTDGTDASWSKVTNLSETSYAQIADATLSTGTHTFDFEDGDMQQLTATGDITIAFDNFTTGRVVTFIIDAVNWGAHTIGHPSAMFFAAGIAPVYTSAGTDRLMIVKDKDEVLGLFVIAKDIKEVA